MSLNQLFNQFLGGGQNEKSTDRKNITDTLGDLGNKIPGGALGGLAAGGLLGVLVGNKKMRKTVGKMAGGAVGLGGAAVLGAVAFNAYKNWKSGDAPQSVSPTGGDASTKIIPPSNPPSIEQASFDPVQNVGADGQPFQIALIKAMIAASNADGHIDKDEQANIFEAVNRLELEPADKVLVFDTLQNPPSVSQIAAMSNGLEQASEVYLASRLAIDPDNAEEHKYLTDLTMMLQLPDDLVIHLEDQMRQKMK
ncbi:tellurite resistance TerB family protein [Lentilitoribacter sp. EG35]|uniref:tellurite resistance TerB family protein n=1 Tax=Lentilitoribacter sp. EG35 TaxID=3234192 RepID=UPI00345FC701